MQTKSSSSRKLLLYFSITKTDLLLSKLIIYFIKLLISGQACAYKKGICSMCGKKIMDTKSYKQSST